MNQSPSLRTIDPAPDDDSFRAPPHNIEAEQALLGAILINNEACDKAVTVTYNGKTNVIQVW